jgi:hypothetical protein
LKELIEDAVAFGLRNEDIKSCKEYLKYTEYDLCFDTLATQLYEYDIKISAEFFEKAQMVANGLNLNSSEYDYLKQIISA